MNIVFCNMQMIQPYLKNKVSVTYCIKILENFSTISGLKLNTKNVKAYGLRN